MISNYDIALTFWKSEDEVSQIRSNREIVVQGQDSKYMIWIILASIPICVVVKYLYD